MLDLAERCEKATGPDRELDVKIGYSVGVLTKYTDPMPPYGALVGVEYAGEQHPLFAPWWPNRRDDRDDLACIAEMTGLPAYTASLDAAMTLVPEGISFEVRRSGTGDKGQAMLWDPMRAPGDLQWRVTGCASPALALCAAALRARATKESKDATG
jgi:hypothetical protein